MKILHVCGGMEIGGQERAIYQLVKAQSATGRRVDILATDQGTIYSRKVAELGATVHSIGQKGGADFTCARKYLKLAKRYDLIHFHNPNPALIITSLLLGRGQQLFYTQRGGDHKFPLRRYLSHRISGFCIKYNFDGISGNTQHAVRSVSKLFRIPEDTVRLTYNGIYFDLLKPRKNATQVLNELGLIGRCKALVGTTAKLINCKRIEFLVQAIAMIDERPVQCFVIGDGPERHKLENLAKQLGVAEKITFVGKKEHVGDYLNVLDVFVLPSNSGESFGNSVVEAMSFGIPTLVMKDGGGLLEHIPRGADLVAEDPSDLARLIKEILDSPKAAKELGARCKTYVRDKYTVQKMKESYDQLYQKTRI